MTDLCHEYGISRPNAYKWIKRYNEVGPEGLLDQSRKPHGCAHATPVEIEDEILALRARFPTWGARKLRARLERINPEASWPAASTIGEILSRAGILGLSKLSLGWLKLGIVHERIPPGRPQQNGRHERMHRTLKEDTAQPPAPNVRAQQKRFDCFRLNFNHERPHEALGNETPGSIYVPSARMFPQSTPEFQYPKGFQTRRVNNSGDISWHKSRVFISEVFRNEEIGLEQMDDDLYRIFFCNLEVGEFDSAELRFRACARQHQLR